MLQGKIKIVNSRGFGFIETPGGIDYFFHYSQFRGDWRKLVMSWVKNNLIPVTFENDETATDGLRAINVKLIETNNGDN